LATTDTGRTPRARRRRRGCRSARPGALAARLPSSHACPAGCRQAGLVFRNGSAGRVRRARQLKLAGHPHRPRLRILFGGRDGRPTGAAVGGGDAARPAGRSRRPSDAVPDARAAAMRNGGAWVPVRAAQQRVMLAVLLADRVGSCRWTAWSTSYGPTAHRGRRSRPFRCTRCAPFRPRPIRP
jgi:hypothetical protein